MTILSCWAFFLRLKPEPEIAVGPFAIYGAAAKHLTFLQRAFGSIFASWYEQFLLCERWVHN